MTALSRANSALDFVDKLAKFLEKIRHYKPELKSLRINYLERTTEMKLLLNIPQGIRRALRHIEIPAYPGYVVNEIFDGSTLNRLNIVWTRRDENWIADPQALTGSDNYFVIMKGSISEESLDELVKLYCPEDPKRTPELDLYWIDSAIKDMAILERIYDELTIDRVTTCVNVGLERQFASSIPREVREWFRARAQADIYLASKDRQKSFKSFYKLRLAERRMGKVSSSDIYKLGAQILSPETFMYFVSVERPFRIASLRPVRSTGLYPYPEKIGVTIETDLNYRTPVAQGDLTYRKVEFAMKIEEEFDNLPGLPAKFRPTGIRYTPKLEKKSNTIEDSKNQPTS